MGKRSTRRSQLYRAARIIGTLSAARRGPTAYAKRAVRRKAYRKANGLMSTVLRRAGMR